MMIQKRCLWVQGLNRKAVHIGRGGSHAPSDIAAAACGVMRVGGCVTCEGSSVVNTKSAG